MSHNQAHNGPHITRTEPPATPPAGRPAAARLWAHLGGWLGRLARGEYLRLDRLQADLDTQSRRFAFGRDLHAACACVWCFFAFWPMPIAEFAAAPLVVCCLLRLIRTHRLWRLWLAPGAMPLALLLALYALWQWLSIGWSANPAKGEQEWEKFRFIAPLFLVFPALERRGWLIAAVALGAFCGLASQALNALGVRFDVPALRHVLAGDDKGWMLATDRNGGWWHPVSAGVILVAALGLHLPAAALGRGWVRWAALSGSALTLAGILATGTRGAILAALALLVVFAAWGGAWGLAHHRAVWRSRRAWLLAGVLALAGAGATLVVGERVASRVQAAVADVRGVIDRRDFNSDNGARLLMAWWAIEAMRERPLRGVGAGGYEAWTRDHVTLQGIDPTTRRFFEHAHFALLHVGATLGLVGLGIAGLVVVVALRAGLSPLWRPRGDGLGAANIAATRRGLSAYEAGPGLALLGVLLVSPFEAVHHASATAAVLGVLLALCPAWRPREMTGPFGTRRASAPAPVPAPPPGPDPRPSGLAP